MFQIRERMKALGMTQVRLIFELRERGIVVQPPEMSQILSGVNTYPKATRVLEMVKQILSVYMILSANSTAIGFFSPQIPCTRACSPPP